MRGDAGSGSRPRFYLRQRAAAHSKWPRRWRRGRAFGNVLFSVPCAAGTVVANSARFLYRDLRMAVTGLIASEMRGQFYHHDLGILASLSSKGQRPTRLSSRVLRVLALNKHNDHLHRAPPIIILRHLR